MEPVDGVRVIEVCRVAPVLAAGCTWIPLTFFDEFFLKSPPFQYLFFYEETLHTTNITTFSDTIFAQLKRSLSLTLQHYLPLAGNLKWDPQTHKAAVHYIDGDAVSLTLAESGVDFHGLSGDGFHEVKEFDPFVPHLAVSETQVAAMALQVTLFPHSGFSIGYTAHHAVVDGRSWAMFVRSWASICRLGGADVAPLPESTPSYDRTVVSDLANTHKSFVERWMRIFGLQNESYIMPTPKNAEPDVFRGTFVLTRKDLEKIKNSVQRPHISSFTAACAHTWACLVNAKENIENKNVVLGITADSRARLNPPLPSNYFGNCLTYCAAAANLEELRAKEGMAVAVEAIAEAIAGLAKKGPLSAMEEWFQKVLTTKDLKVLGIGGSPRFELYSSNFGWGRPRKIEMASVERVGDLSLLESRDDDGGMEIGIMLRKHEMESFASLFARALQAL